MLVFEGLRVKNARQTFTYSVGRNGAVLPNKVAHLRAVAVAHATETENERHDARIPVCTITRHRRACTSRKDVNSSGEI